MAARSGRHFALRLVADARRDGGLVPFAGHHGVASEFVPKVVSAEFIDTAWYHCSSC